MRDIWCYGVFGLSSCYCTVVILNAVTSFYMLEKNRPQEINQIVSCSNVKPQQDVSFSANKHTLTCCQGIYFQFCLLLNLLLADSISSKWWRPCQRRSYSILGCIQGLLLLLFEGTLRFYNVCSKVSVIPVL